MRAIVASYMDVTSTMASLAVFGLDSCASPVTTMDCKFSNTFMRAPPAIGYLNSVNQLSNSVSDTCGSEPLKAMLAQSTAKLNSLIRDPHGPAGRRTEPGNTFNVHDEYLDDYLATDISDYVDESVPESAPDAESAQLSKKEKKKAKKEKKKAKKAG